MSKSIWKKEISLDLLNSFSAKTMLERIGIRFTEIGDDYLSSSMPVDERTHQPFGILHGGASAALIETLGSVASTWAVAANQYCVGVEVNANHVRSKRSGTVVGTARPIHTGREIQVWQIDIRDEEERLISSGRITLAVRTKK